MLRSVPSFSSKGSRVLHRSKPCGSAVENFSSYEDSYLFPQGSRDVPRLSKKKKRLLYNKALTQRCEEYHKCWLQRCRRKISSKHFFLNFSWLPCCRAHRSGFKQWNEPRLSFLGFCSISGGFLIAKVASRIQAMEPTKTSIPVLCRSAQLSRS
ncbi:hypothetical protein Dimus_000860 [Dionaea muscipula]